jgi:hypothetical protein
MELTRNHHLGLCAPAGRPQGSWLALGLTLVMAGVAVALGYAASTADPVFIGMTVAGVAGLTLLARPVWIVTLTLLLGLLVVGLVPLWADAAANKALWGVSIVGFCLIAAATLRAMAGREALQHTPAFVWLALAFMLIAVVNSIVQFRAPMDFIGGFKRYFSMWGLMFCLAWLALPDQQLARWRRLFVWVAIVQSPFALYELIVYVPYRERVAYAYPGLVPIDVVAGTFGATRLGGGSSSEMAAFLVLVLAIILSRWREQALDKSPLMLGLFVIVAAPLFIGETKIVLFVLPLTLLVLYRREILRNPAQGLMVLVFGAGAVAVLGSVYLSIMGMTLQRAIDDSLAYNVGTTGYGLWKLNRTTVITFWFEKQGWHDPVSVVFGNGLSAAMDSTDPPGYLARHYAGMGIGLTAASQLLWEQGIVGVLLFSSILVSAWRVANRLMSTAREAWVRADAAALQTVLPVFFLWLFYRNTLIESLPIQIVFACVLGYLAWLWRREQRAAPARRRR